MHYLPNDDVAKYLQNVNFVAVVGPTAVGKTTIIGAAARKYATIKPVLSATSRTPREGERDDVDFHFCTEAKMRENIKNRRYVQVAPPTLGALYATAPEDYATEGVAVMPVMAEAIADFRQLPFRTCRVVFIVPKDVEQWKQRLQSRSFTPQQLERRRIEAHRSLQFALTDPAVRFVQNDRLEEAVEDFARATQSGTYDNPSVLPTLRNMIAYLESI
jgi:guanylate kinase